MKHVYYGPDDCKCGSPTCWKCEETLAMCKVCGQAEAELEEECPGPCRCPCHTGEQGIIMHDGPCCDRYDRTPDDLRAEAELARKKAGMKPGTECPEFTAVLLRPLDQIDFSTYQRATRETAVYPGACTGSPEALLYVTLGLVNEAGEVCGKVKKTIRGDGSAGHVGGPVLSSTGVAMLRIQESRGSEAIAGEIGDVLWYLARLADEHGLELADVAAANVAKLQSRKERGVIKGSGDDR